MEIPKALLVLKVSKNIDMIRDITRRSSIDILHTLFICSENKAVSIKLFDTAFINLLETKQALPINWLEAVAYATESDEIYANAIHHNFYLIHTNND